MRGSLLAVEIERTCCRCGVTFRVANRLAHVCPGCLLPKTKPPRGELRGAALSPRELQVVRLAAEAKPNKIIAFELHLTEGTIKEYLNRVYHKLGLSNRTKLAVWYLKQQFSALDVDGRHDGSCARQGSLKPHSPGYSSGPGEVASCPESLRHSTATGDLSRPVNVTLSSSL